LARNGLATLTADAAYDPVEEAKGPKAVFSFAAVFAEVRVDPEFGLVRLNRYVGAPMTPAASSISRPRAARRSAAQALLEQSEPDPVLGRFLNRNYSRYLVPTNADIPEVDVLFLGEFDGQCRSTAETGCGARA
jgi:xanthine dehydrogenase YagR molybdenum-binding subunit